jgi:hypothetical protein
MQRLDAEAARVANRLGASHAVVIAFWPDDEDMHVVDGGTSPIALKELYLNMATARVIAGADDKDVTVQ